MTHSPELSMYVAHPDPLTQGIGVALTIHALLPVHVPQHNEFCVALALVPVKHRAG